MVDYVQSVDLVVQQATGAYVSQVPDRVRLTNMGVPRMSLALLPLACYLRRERPDVLLSAMMHTNIVAVLARKLARVDTRVVVTEHRPIQVASRNSRSLRDRYLAPFLARCVYPWADEVVAVSNGVADDLASSLRLPRERISVIYNPATSAEVLAKAGEPVDHPWFREGEPPVVLGAGRLTPTKGFRTLVHATSLVCQTRAVHLVILGEGNERRSLAAFAAEMGISGSVHMPGFVANPYKYMASADVFVLSSRWEGFGLVLVEAMACGTPVVSTNCPYGPAEILENGRYGALVPPGEPEKLAEAILQTLAKPLPGNILKARAEDFRVERIAQQYLDLLQEGDHESLV
jgi:glycosyltransferase involved in cell wall biosynthesis